MMSGTEERKNEEQEAPVYVTVTGTKHYDHGNFFCGDVLCCVKEPDNPVDSEAIFAMAPASGKIGYLANAWSTTVRGTWSAGRVYDKVDNTFFVEVLFLFHGTMVARLLPTTPEVKERYDRQGSRRGDGGDPPQVLYLEK